MSKFAYVARPQNHTIVYNGSHQPADTEWQEKAERLQDRRWRIIHQRERDGI
jgi:hypothetical protein